MSLQLALDSFWEDATVKAILVLVVLDLVLGVFAALKARTFRLSYLADFLRNDVLGKVAPYFAVWWGLHIVGDIEIGDLEILEESVGAFVIGALLGSVLNSLKDVRTPVVRDFPEPIAGPDLATPGP